MRINPVLIIIVISFSSCIKESEKEIKVDIVVIDANHGTPIEGANFFLNDENQHSLGISDSNGRFKGLYEAHTRMWAGAILNPYFPLDNKYVNPGEEITGNMRLLPPGYYRIMLENTMPYNSNDFIGINFSGNGSYYYSFYGDDVNDTIVFRWESEQINYFTWKVIKNGVITDYDTTIFVSEWDTVDLKINY